MPILYTKSNVKFDNYCLLVHNNNISFITFISIQFHSSPINFGHDDLFLMPQFRQFCEVFLSVDNLAAASLVVYLQHIYSVVRPNGASV